MQRVTILSLSVAAAVGIAIGTVFHARLGVGVASAKPAAAPAVPPLHGQATWPAGRRPAPAFALRDQRGRRVSLRSLRGRPVVLMFEPSTTLNTGDATSALTVRELERL